MFDAAIGLAVQLHQRLSARATHRRHQAPPFSQLPDQFIDQCGRVFAAKEFALDEEGSVLAIGETAGDAGVALVDDRDIARYEPRAADMGRLTRAEAARRGRTVG